MAPGWDLSCVPAGSFQQAWLGSPGSDLTPFSFFSFFLLIVDFICCAVFNNHLGFFYIDIFLYAFNCFVYRKRAKITGFLSLTKKINIIIYALLLRRHEHCSISVCKSLSIELTWCIVFHWNKTVYFGHFRAWLWGYVCLIFIIFCFSVWVKQADKTCEKSFTNNSSRVLCVCIHWKSENRAVCKPLWCFFVFFYHLPVNVWEWLEKNSRTSWFNFSRRVTLVKPWSTPGFRL